MMWTDPTIIDTLTTAATAQAVKVRLTHQREPFHAVTNPFVKVIEVDIALRGFASYILYEDIADRLNAFSHVDYSGRIFPIKAESFVVLERNRGYDIDANLAAFGSGREVLPDASWSVDGLHSVLAQVPDPHVGTISRNDGPGHYQTRGQVDPRTHDYVPGTAYQNHEPGMARNPPGSYSPTAAMRRGSLLNVAVSNRQAANAALDAGLAATIAATRIASRASLLARAQALYPTRGYT